MKKKLLASVLTIAMFAAIVGCGSSKTTEVPVEKATTEAATTEAPEVATTEAKPQMATEKVEVDIDPETYEWSDDEKIIYFDGISENEYYKEYDPFEDTYVVGYKGETDGEVWDYHYYEYARINEFIKFVYECNAIAEGLDENGVIGYFSDEAPDEIDYWYDQLQVTYIKGDDSYCFHTDNERLKGFGTAYLTKEVKGKEVWTYPLSDNMRNVVAEFIEASEGAK